VDGLGRSIYAYDPRTDLLVQRGGEAAVKGVQQSFSVPEDSLPVSSAAVVFLLVGRPWRAMRKYGDRGARLMLMEAGCIAEHLNLAATSLGLASVDCSSVHDVDVHEALRIDGTHEMLLHTLVVGSSGS
jgi:SagB-type dehydrogenase family enzyme